MAKKYLSLEEAAGLLEMTTDQLMKVRERGDIRGFADRGSWKFREQDVEEFQRSQQADSSPDFPIITGGSSSSVLEEPDAADLAASDSDVRLFFDESLFDDKEAQDLATSGSDVQLTGDSGPNLEKDDSEDDLDLSGWGSDAKLSDSDSDVKLVGAGTEADIDLGATIEINDDSDSDVVMVRDTDGDVSMKGDSDVKLSDSDSDVRLSGTDDSDVKLDNKSTSGKEDMASTEFLDVMDSDSDVKLMGGDDLLLPDEDSDSDVKLSADLDRTDSDIRLAEPSPPPTARRGKMPLPADDSDLKLIKKGSDRKKEEPDSGITLEVRGSGLGLDADESGISLEMDSGISLEADDSGISLESYDSGTDLRGGRGVSLEGFESGTNLADDSGITLDAGDSGITLDLDDDSGISMEPNDMGQTMPMHAIPGAAAALSDSNAMTTQFEMPKPGAGNDSEFELAGLDDDDDEVGANTGVLTFEDEEDLDSSRTVAVPSLAGAAIQDEVEEDTFEDDDEDEFSGDEYEEEGDLDVHDSEEFEDDDFEAGQSQVAGFPVPARAGFRVDPDWGIGTKVMISVSALLSVMCAVVGIELVRTMWLWTQPSGDAPVSGILQMIGGAF